MKVYQDDQELNIDDLRDKATDDLSKTHRQVDGLSRLQTCRHGPLLVKTLYGMKKRVWEPEKVSPPAFDCVQALVYSSMEELLLSSYGQMVHYPKSTCNHPSVVRPRTTCDRS